MQMQILIPMQVQIQKADVYNVYKLKHTMQMQKLKMSKDKFKYKYYYKGRDKRRKYKYKNPDSGPSGVL